MSPPGSPSQRPQEEPENHPNHTHDHPDPHEVGTHTLSSHLLKMHARAEQAEQESALGLSEEKGFLKEFQGRLKDKPKIQADLTEKFKEEKDIRALRNGGVSLKENDENELEKFERLAAAFLAPAVPAKNTEGHTEFLVDFAGNELAEWNVGAGHCLPPSVARVRVFDENGDVLFQDAERGIKNGKVGYFEKSTGAYVAIHTGYRIELLDTLDAKKEEDKPVLEKAFAEEKEFFERNEQKTALLPVFQEFFDKKGWKVFVSECDFEENLVKYVGSRDAEWWKEYKKTGVLNEGSKPLILAQFEEAFSREEGVFLGNLALVKIAVDLARLPSLLSTTELVFLKKPFSKAEDIRHEFESRKLAGRLTPDGFLLPEALASGEKIDRKYWASLMGDKPESIEPRILTISFLGRKYQVNKYVAPYFLEAEARLRSAGIDYTSTNGGGYQYRKTWAKPADEHTHYSELSLHSWGVAIDINPHENPPHEGGYSTVPTAMVSIMALCGFEWGGNWRGYDYDPMHFQFSKNPFEFASEFEFKNEQAKQLATRSGLRQEVAV